MVVGETVRKTGEAAIGKPEEVARSYMEVAEVDGVTKGEVTEREKRNSDASRLAGRMRVDN